MTNILEKTVQEIRAKDKKTGEIVELITKYGDIDGQDHKQWLLDQIMRTVLGHDYETWKNVYEKEKEYEWDEGRDP